MDEADAAELTELAAAHGEVVAVVEAIPEAALDWRPGEGEWSLKQTIGHIAHAYDFYATIVEEARAQSFEAVTLHADTPGYRRMLATDADVAHCATVAAVLERLNQAYLQALAVLQGIGSEELDRPFAFYRWQSETEPVMTTLRRRVIQTATEHLREHRGHLLELLVVWKPMG